MRKRTSEAESTGTRTERRDVPLEEDDEDVLWIFGYGSLVWRPAFAHAVRRPAWIDGYARRFWQASMDHRGLPECPGRVVTLLSDTHPSLAIEADFRPAPCWGTAYAIPRSDPDGVLERLDHRERAGYERVELDIHLRIERAAEPTQTTVRGLVYIAGPENDHFVGHAPLEAIAAQIAGAHGPSGANPEYVFELARSLRDMEASDPHVFGVEAALIERGRPGGTGR